MTQLRGGLRGLAALLLVGWAVACSSETAEEAPLDAMVGIDAAPDGSVRADAEPTTDPDAGPAAAGAPCTLDTDCEGLCVDDGAGLRCATACVDDSACPPDQGCTGPEGRRVCGGAWTEAGLGAACDGVAVRCAGDAICAVAGEGGARCWPACGQDADCATEGHRCAPAGACLPPEADAFSCATTGCADERLRCVRLAPDGPARCLTPCFDPMSPCADEAACVAPADAEGWVCAPRAGALGDGCAAGGECAGEAQCLARRPGDPAAVCAVPCEAGGACGDGFACRRPAGFDGPYCVPAPFGVGDGQGAAGASCATHGATDCAPELDCVDGVATDRRCAAPCGAGCAEGFTCSERPVDGAYCLPGSGGLGTPCADDAACDAGRCVPLAAEAARFCGVACEGGCPMGSDCDGAWCRPLDAAPAEPLGAACGDGAPCASGLCAVDPASGEARCSQQCSPQAPCPEGFACTAVGAQSLCF